MNVLMTCGCALDSRTHRELWRVLHLAAECDIAAATRLMENLPEPPQERDWSLPLKSEAGYGETITP